MLEIGQHVVLTQDAICDRNMNADPIFVIEDITYDEIDDEYVYVLDADDCHLTAYEVEIEPYDEPD